MARNKFASAHVNQADAILAHVIATKQAPAFTQFPQPDQFECAKDYLEELARALDEVAYQVIRDASDNSTSNISYKDRTSIFSDALRDSEIISDLNDAAHSFLEAAE